MSLRTRLLLAVGAVALVCLVIADVVTYQYLHSQLYGQLDQSLQMAHVPIEHALGVATRAQAAQGGLPSTPSEQGTTVPGSAPGASSQPEAPGGLLPGSQVGVSQLLSGGRCPIVGIAPGSYVEVRDAKGATVGHCSLPGPNQETPAPPQLPKKITGFSAPSTVEEPVVYFDAPSSGGGYRVRASIIEAAQNRRGGVLIVAQPLGTTSSTLNDLLAAELILTAAALVASMCLGWWLVRVGLKPLRQIETTADSIATGELDQRVPGDDKRTEVGRLARALNVMLARIQSAFAQRDLKEAELRESEERMRQFVADASHELRTPISAVAAYAELFGRGASNRPQDLSRVINGIQGETARMSHLVDDLLLLARLDEGRPLEEQPVELVELVAESVQTATTVAPEWPVRMEASAPVEVLGDRARLRQVFDNLLANVRSHTPQGTSAVVTVGRDSGDAFVSVADRGPGLTHEQATHVFERFYRADSSRSRRHGGAGLGLSIVASIVRAHGGIVEAGPASEDGAVFTVKLPLLDGSWHPAGNGQPTQHEQLTAN